MVVFETRDVIVHDKIIDFGSFELVLYGRDHAVHALVVFRISLNPDESFERGECLPRQFFIDSLHSMAGPFRADLIILIEDADLSNRDDRECDFVLGLEMFVHLGDCQRPFELEFVPVCEIRGDGLDWAEEDVVVGFVLVLDGRHGLTEHPERQRQVHIRVVESGLFHAQHFLDDFDADSPYDHGCSGGQSRDDLASDQLDLEVGHLSDLVIPRPQVRDAAHTFNVEVCGIVFLELNDLDGF